MNLQRIGMRMNRMQLPLVRAFFATRAYYPLYADLSLICSLRTLSGDTIRGGRH